MIDALPRMADLSDRQIRGVDCVFCGIVLTSETAVDLGPRLRAEASGRWFPRACRTHPEAQALAAPPTRPIPPVRELTSEQWKGWRCVWCSRLLDDTAGAQHVGYARGRQGAHILDCEAYACRTCREETW